MTMWLDSIRKFIQTVWDPHDEAATNSCFWMILAEDREPWRDLEKDYIEYLSTGRPTG